MSTRHKIANLIGVPLPLIGLVVAIVLLWNRAIGPLELALLIGLYVVTALGVTLGYHRMFTHRAFESSRPFRAIIAVLGSMAVAGVGHHLGRRPSQAPRVHRPGRRSRTRRTSAARASAARSRACGTPTSAGCSRSVGTAERERFAPDLVKDRVVRAVDKLFWVWVVLGFAIPFALGWIVGGGLGTALTALLWGGFVRVFLLHHVTWSINSVCHFFGRRRFDIEDESRNVFWLAPLSMGESWHHNHHAFPTSAFHGLRFWERIADPTGLVIAAAREARDRLERGPGQPRAPGGQDAADGRRARRSPAGLATSSAALRAAAYAQPLSSGPIVSPASSSCSQ